MNATIREEQPRDVPAIRRVNEDAFGQPQEALLVELLRSNDAILLSLVAEVDERLVGHVLFSPVWIGELEGAGLGPLAVLPEHQRMGIGSQLVSQGLRALRERGRPFVVVLGHAAYYPRFGFVPAARHDIRCEWDVPDEVFMVLLLDPLRLRGISGVARYRDEFATVSQK